MLDTLPDIRDFKGKYKGYLVLKGQAFLLIKPTVPMYQIQNAEEVADLEDIQTESDMRLAKAELDEMKLWRSAVAQNPARQTQSVEDQI